MLCPCESMRINDAFAPFTSINKHGVKQGERKRPASVARRLKIFRPMAAIYDQSIDAPTAQCHRSSYQMLAGAAHYSEQLEGAPRHYAACVTASWPAYKKWWLIRHMYAHSVEDKEKR